MSDVVVSGGAEGRRADSRCWRADLLILALELELRLRGGGPPASVIPASLEEPRKNGGGGLRVKDDVELVALVAESRRRCKSGADGNVPIGIRFAPVDLG